MTRYFDLDFQSLVIAIWPVFADAAAKGLIVLSVAWAATLAMRRSSAAMRHLTWVLAVFGILLLPILSALTPGWRILPAWMAVQPVAATSSVSQANGREPALTLVGPRRENVAARFARRSDLPRTIAAAPPEALVSPQTNLEVQPVEQSQTAELPARTWSSRISWQAAALVVWGCGVGIMMLPVMISLLGLWRLGRRSPRFEGGHWGRLLADCAKLLGSRHPITLLRGRRHAMPMTWGIVTTKLLLPAEADQWSIDRRRVVIMHELAHAQRRDFLAQLIVHLARACFWFNPLIWIACKQIALESEGACDDLVLRHEVKASDYAEHVLAVAAGVKDGNLFCTTAVAMAQPSRLEGRLMGILDAGRDRRTPSVATIAIAISLLAGGLLPLAMLRAGVYPTHANAAQPPVSANAPAADDDVNLPVKQPVLPAWSEWLQVRTWSWVKKDAVRPTKPWDELFRNARNFSHPDTEAGQLDFLWQLQLALDTIPPRAGDLEIRLAIGDAMVANFSHRMTEEAIPWYVQTIERFKDLAPSTGTLLARVRLAELLSGHEDRELYRPVFTRLLNEVLDAPDATVLIVDNGKFLTLDNAHKTKYPPAERKRMADSGAPLDNLDQLDVQYGQRLVKERGERIADLHAAATGTLVRGQWGDDGGVRTRERLLLLQNSRPDDKAVQQAIAKYLQDIDRLIAIEVLKAKGALPPAAGELTGSVTDEAGNPLAGVLVDVWTWCAGDETTTDRQGRFILTKLGAEPVEIRFSKEGFSPWYNPVEPTGKNAMKVKLSSKTYFEGDVKGPDGKPLKNALVRADAGPKSNPGVQITTVWTETRSDQNGHYRLYVMPDKYRLQVHVPKVGAVRVPETLIRDGEAKKLKLNLVPGVRFQAIVVDSKTGKPVPNVQLTHWQHKGVEGTSGNDGKIAIDGMSAGKFTFNVWSPGYARWWSPQATQPHHRKDVRDSLQQNFDFLEFDVTDDMAPVTIELEREVRITGVVHNPEGKPVAGATVAPAHTGTGNSLTGDTRYSVPTAKDGTFVMTLPASGDARYNLTAHDGHHGQWRKWANGVLDPIQTKPGDELKNVVINLTRPATVRGHMKDESGKPLVGREVRASAADRLENRYYDPTTKTDENGDFELRFIRPGDQFIQAAPFFWTNVPPGGMTLKLKAGETNSQTVNLTEGETKAGVQLTAPASTAFPSHEEQLRRVLETMKSDDEK